jgi:hypothetical protein
VNLHVIIKRIDIETRHSHPHSWNRNGGDLERGGPIHTQTTFPDDGFVRMQMIKSWNVGGGGGGRADASYDSSGERKEIDGIISLYPLFIFPPSFYFWIIYASSCCMDIISTTSEKNKTLVWPSVWMRGGTRSCAII